MKRIILGGLLAAATLASGLAVTSAVSAQETETETENKVWVCHATSGLGELKNGYNLIFVDLESTRRNGDDHRAHATTDPKVNKKFGDPADNYHLYDDIDDVNPNDLAGSKCGAPPAVVVTPSVTYTKPECDVAGKVERSQGVGYTWVDNQDGTWTAKTDKGYAIDGDDTFGPYEIDKITSVPPCPTTPPPPPPPPADVPAVTPEVAAKGPVPAQTPTTTTPPTTTAAAAVAATPTQLPTTGSSSWVTALLALAALLGGTGLVRLSRRPTD